MTFDLEQLRRVEHRDRESGGKSQRPRRNPRSNTRVTSRARIVLSRLCLLATLGGVLAPSLAAQSEKTVPIPPGVLKDMAAQFAPRFRGDSDPELRSLARPDRLSRHIEAHALDVNNDGRPEYLIDGLPPLLCGAQNCSYWLYQRRPDGRFRLLLDEQLLLWMELLSTSSHGYRDVLGVMHWGWQTTVHRTFSYDGTRYTDVATELHDETKGSVFRVRSPLAAPGQPPRVMLDGLPVRRSPGIRISAEYTACPPTRATRGRLCGEPRLVVSEPRAAGRLPSAGPACFKLQVDTTGVLRNAGNVECFTLSRPSSSGARRLAFLRLTAAQWKAVARAREIRLGSTQGSIRIDGDAAFALSTFAYEVFSLNGMQRPDWADVWASRLNFD